MEQEGELIVSVCESSYQGAAVFVLWGKTEPLRSPEVLWYVVCCGSRTDWVAYVQVYLSPSGWYSSMHSVILTVKGLVIALSLYLFTLVWDFRFYLPA